MNILVYIFKRESAKVGETTVYLKNIFDNTTLKPYDFFSLHLQTWVFFSVLSSDNAGAHSIWLLHWKAPQHNIDLRFLLMIFVLRTREIEASKPLPFDDCMNNQSK